MSLRPSDAAPATSAGRPSRFEEVLRIGQAHRSADAPLRLPGTEPVDGPVRDLFSELSVRQKLLARMEMKNILEGFKSEVAESDMTVELYAGSAEDKLQQRPIAILLSPALHEDGERLQNLPAKKGFERFLYGNPEGVRLKFEMTKDNAYTLPFSFVPMGFRLVDPPPWLSFADTPNEHGLWTGLDEKWLYVSQGERGANIYPSYDAFLKLKNISPESLARVLEPEFDASWRDIVSMEQSWTMRTRVPYRPRADPLARLQDELRRERLGIRDRGPLREAVTYKEEDVAKVTVNLRFEPSREEKARRLRYVQEKLAALPEYQILLESANPNSAFAALGPKRSEKMLFDVIYPDGWWQRLDESLPGMRGGKLVKAEASMNLIGPGVEAWEKHVAATRAGKRGREGS